MICLHTGLYTRNTKMQKGVNIVRITPILRRTTKKYLIPKRYSHVGTKKKVAKSKPPATSTASTAISTTSANGIHASQKAIFAANELILSGSSAV